MAVLNSRQRSYLMKLAASENPLLQIGKAGLTPEVCEAVSEALEARELVKVALLKNCFEDIRNLADALWIKHKQGHFLRLASDFQGLVVVTETEGGDDFLQDFRRLGRFRANFHFA